MFKSNFLLCAAVCCLCFLFTACSDIARDDMQDVITRVETALDENWEKRSKTEVFPLVYGDDAGHSIVYYLCLTTYYNTAPTKPAALDTDAICTVLDPDTAEKVRDCDVNGLPAAIFHKDALAYLCWTVSPEISCILSYDPTVQDENDIFHMAQSVPTETAN